MTMSNNKKSILCFNVINHNQCNYKNMCNYAHGLHEQNIHPLRHKIYNMIANKVSMKDIDLKKSPEIYNVLLTLTKICTQCNQKKCTGGYNCKNGAIGSKYHICHTDLIYGNCTNKYCEAKHLTKDNELNYYNHQDDLEKKYKKDFHNYLWNSYYNSTNSESFDEDDYYFQNINLDLDSCDESIFIE